MKSSIKTTHELSEADVKQAICYWLREECNIHAEPAQVTLNVGTEERGMQWDSYKVAVFRNAKVEATR